jgi:hypothetical protein
MVAYKETPSVHTQRPWLYGQRIWSLLTVVICVWSLAILGCGGDDDDTRQLSANLTGAQEVPPVNTSAAGTATLRINEEGTRIDFTLTVSTAPQSPIREAHLHIAPAGVNGPIVLDFCTTSLVSPPANVPLPPACPSPPFTLSGSLTVLNLRTLTSQQIQATGVNSFADTVNQILAGNAYANVHTENFRGGEIRGQLILQQ